VTALRISDLRAEIRGKEILRGLDLEVPFGEIHALMGPNGSGKSTLCHVLTGRDDYEVSGSVVIDGEELLDQPIDERARLGLLHAFQYPVEVPGVALRDLMWEAAEERGIDPSELERRVDEAGERLGVTPFLDRAVNDDLSGGEKKRSELFQIEVLRPSVAVLDELDSGLDIDAVRQVAAGVEGMRSPDRAILMITHYNRMFRYLTPDRVHVIIDGRIVQSGGPELADDLEAGGYTRLRERLGIAKAEPEEEQLPKPSEQLTETPFDL
jgi:Fe-S cluster assembly ATP-binding protein